jgi:glycosyltransferase involved in cell wall biosynthesis
MIGQTDILYLARSRLQYARANLIQTLHTSSALTELGCRVCVILPSWPKRLSVADRLHELDINPAPEVRASYLLHPRWSFWPYVWWYRRQLLKVPVIYTRVARISLALARAGLPSHLEVHNVQALHDSGQLGAIVAHHRAGLIRTLIPISDAAGQRLIEVGANPDCVCTARSGVKLEAYNNIPPFDAARLDRPRIVHIGRLSQVRGHDVFQYLGTQGQCKITVVGADSTDIKNAAHHPPVPLREVPTWYARSDITLLPYQPSIPTATTMSPIKMFEAMAAGRPIIASDLPAIREVLRHEHTALLVAPENPAAWGEAIDRLRRDRSLALRLASNVRAEASNYSWLTRAQTIVRAIRRCSVLDRHHCTTGTDSR